MSQLNAIALSAEFHTHPEYDRFYKTFCDKLNGFTGIYSMIETMAGHMTEWETAQELKLGKNMAWDGRNVSWIEACEMYVQNVIGVALLAPDLFNGNTLYQWNKLAGLIEQ